MDPLSITGAAIGIVQLLGACIKLARNHFGHARQTVSVQDLFARLEEFNHSYHAITVLQSYLFMENPNTNMEDIFTYYNQAYLSSFQSALVLLELEQHQQLRGSATDSTSSTLLSSPHRRNKFFIPRFLSNRRLDRKLKHAIDQIVRRQQALFFVVLLIARSSQIQRRVMREGVDVPSQQNLIDDKAFSDGSRRLP
ncbi:hypothetical protein V8F20_002313 [Naviculisporaceae sp. PSN 640]